jgi:predicted esterase
LRASAPTAWLRIGVTAAALAAVAGTTGCAILDKPAPPGRAWENTEPDTGREYRLYVPTSYRGDLAWPVVVTCRGPGLLDSTAMQIREWGGLAETKGFLIVAPELASLQRGIGEKPEDTIEKLYADERAILAILAHVRASRNIDANRVFLAGWLEGCYAAMFTGLRNPDCFRAIVLRQPKFKPECLQPALPFLDAYQPIDVIYGLTDFARDQAKACVAWLRERRMSVTELETGSAHERDPGAAVSFFRRVVEKRPWIRIRAGEADPQHPLTVRFSVRASVEPTAYDWDFGDGNTSKIAGPEHTYAKPGLYVVQVTLRAESGRHTRRIEIRVPRTRLGAPPPAGAKAADGSETNRSE